MTTSHLPARHHPFDPPTGPGYDGTGREIEMVTCPTGIQAWLVRSYAATREVLGDPARFQVCSTFAHVLPLFPVDRPVDSEDFERMDGEAHRRIRKQLSSELLSTEAMNDLRDRIDERIQAGLDGLRSRTGPVDLYDDFAWPVAAAIATEYLGLSPEAGAVFHRQALLISSGDTSEEELSAAVFSVQMVLHRSLRRMRRSSRDGLLSKLIENGSGMSDDGLAGFATGVLMGHFSVANMLTFAVAALLCHPPRWPALACDPASAPQAVEEVVRYLAVPQGVLRQVTADTTLAGQDLRSGDLVIAAIATANRDPALYDDPDRLDPHREPAAHLAFGHGPHYCIGHRMARLELSLALEALATRIPTLRLATAPADLRFRTGNTVGGPEHLPVTWDTILDRPANGR